MVICNLLSVNLYSEKTIEGYLDSVPALPFNAIVTKLIMHEFHSSRYKNIVVSKLDENRYKQTLAS